MRRVRFSLVVVAALAVGCSDSGDGASSFVAAQDAGGDTGGAGADGGWGGGDDVAADIGAPRWGDAPAGDDAGPGAADATGGADTGGGADAGWGDAVGGDALADAGGWDAAADAGQDTAPDVALPDAGEDATGAADATDAGEAPDTADAGPDSVDPPVCDLGDLGDEDRPRVVLVGHPFTAKPGVAGTDIRSMSLEPGGLPVDDGMLLDVGFRPSRIGFVPSGSHALVVGEDGEVASVAVGSAQDLLVVDEVKLPGADYGDIAFSADGTVAWVVGLNVDQTSGVSVVHIGCDGTLTIEPEGFLNIRLAESLAVLPGDQTAVLLGGQTVFAPVDPHDLRLLGRDGDAWVELSAHDVFQDFVGAGRIAASPDGSVVLVPNDSYFSDESGHISVLSTAGGVLAEIDRLTELTGVSEALFGVDGQTALVSRPEANRVAILSDTGAGLQVTGEVKGLGLADQMAVVTRGSLAGTVLVPSVDVNGGPNLAVLRIDGVGIVSDLGQVELGPGSEAIPDAIAVMP